MPGVLHCNHYQPFTDRSIRYLDMSVSYEFNNTLVFAGTSDPCFQINLMVSNATGRGTHSNIHTGHRAHARNVPGRLNEHICGAQGRNLYLVSSYLTRPRQNKLGLDPSRGYLHLVDAPAERVG